MTAKSKLDLNSLTDGEVPDLATLIVTSIGTNPGAATFPAPAPALSQLTAQAKTMNDAIAARDALLQQAQTLTLQIRTARTSLEGSLTAESAYVDAVVAKLPADQQAAAITSAGMAVAGGTGAPVGPMPKVEGVTATAGDAEGTIDLSWNAIRRGLQNFLIELTDDAAGQSGWRFAANSRKSNATITGLASGKRYWFRVTAEGAAGPGPASNPPPKSPRSRRGNPAGPFTSHPFPTIAHPPRSRRRKEAGTFPTTHPTTNPMKALRKHIHARNRPFPKPVGALAIAAALQCIVVAQAPIASPAPVAAQAQGGTAMAETAANAPTITKAGGALLPADVEKEALIAEAAKRLMRTGNPLEDLIVARHQTAAEMNAVQDAVKGRGNSARLDAMIAWHRQNAARMEAIGRLTQQVAAALPRFEPQLIQRVEIPADASADLEEFLVERARQFNAGIRLQQRLEAEPGNAQAIREQWRAEDAASAERQRPLMDAVRAQTADWLPEVPLHPQLPLDASPELAAYLTERHAILRERTEAARQAAKAAPGTNEEAAARWDAANKARLDRLAEKAARLPER